MTKKPETDEEMAAIRVSGTATPSNAPAHLADYDPSWPRLYDGEATKIRTALGDGAIVLEHVGSTSIPGLSSKPLIDILLAVANSADEDSYVPALTAQGYRLHLREPDWEQHRVMKGDDPLVNLHVFTAGSGEITRMLAFRDRLRNHPEELRLYEQPSANWPPAPGATSSTTPTPKAMWSKRSSPAPWPMFPVSLAAEAVSG